MKSLLLAWYRRYKRFVPIYLLLLLTLFKGIAWVIITPIFQGPDENRHYLYSAFVAEFKRLPRQEILFVPSEFQVASSAVEFGKTLHTGMKQNFVQGLFGEHESELRSLALTHRVTGESTTQVFGNAQVYPPMYYILGALIYKIFSPLSFIERFYAMRVGLLALSIITVYFSFLLALEFFHKILPSLAVAVAVAFLPQFSFLSAVLNNDNLLIATTVIFLYLGLRSIHRGLDIKQSILIGLVGGLACLAKYQAVIIIAAGVAVILYQYSMKEKRLTDALKYGGLIFGIILLVSGWWYARNFILFGSLFGVDIESLKLAATADRPGILVMLGWTFLYIFMLITDFLGEFGWADIFLPDSYYVFFALLITIALAGFIWVCLKKKIVPEQKKRLTFFLVSTGSLCLMMLFLFLWTLYKTGFPGRFNQARSFFSVLPVIFILAFWPVEFLSSFRFRRILYTGIAFYFIAVNFLSLYNYMIFGYYA